jgi:hypothetical protein
MIEAHQFFQRVTGKGDMLKTYKPCGIYANTPVGYMLLHMPITGLSRTSRTAPMVPCAGVGEYGRIDGGVNPCARHLRIGRERFVPRHEVLRDWKSKS